MFTELDAVLHQLGQGVAPSGPHALDTNGTSADKPEASHPRRCVRSKRTKKKKKVWGANEVGRFFVAGATDADGKLSHFFSASAVTWSRDEALVGNFLAPCVLVTMYISLLVLCFYLIIFNGMYPRILSRVFG